jgi:PKD domain
VQSGEEIAGTNPAKSKVYVCASAAHNPEVGAIDTGGVTTMAEGDVVFVSADVVDPGIIDSPFAYAWTITKDGLFYGSSTEEIYEFVPADDGVYVLSLTVTDKDGAAGTDSVTITLNNTPPEVQILGVPTGVREGAAIGLLADAWDPGEDDVLSYSWTVTRDGSPFTSGSGPSIEFTADDNGNYVVNVTVTDGDGGSDTDTQTFTVENAPPRLRISGPSEIFEGYPYDLSLYSADPGNDTIASWRIDWGDGTSQIVPGDPSYVTHFFQSGSGVYEITAEVSDEDGSFAYTHWVEVRIK